MNTKTAVDVKKFAEILGVEEASAYGFLRTLSDLGMVQIVKRPQPEGKKGKPANLYVLTDETGPMLGRLLLSKLMDLNKLEEVKKAGVPLEEDTIAPVTLYTADVKKTEAA